MINRSHPKKRILVKYLGGAEFQPAVIHQYFEDLKRGTNPAEKGGRPKDFFEIASYNRLSVSRVHKKYELDPGLILVLQTHQMNCNSINLQDKLARFSDHWSPKIPRSSLK